MSRLFITPEAEHPPGLRGRALSRLDPIFGTRSRTRAVEKGVVMSKPSNSAESERSSELGNRLILGNWTWSHRCDADHTVGCGSFHRGCRARTIRTLTADGRTP